MHRARRRHYRGTRSLQAAGQQRAPCFIAVSPSVDLGRPNSAAATRTDSETKHPAHSGVGNFLLSAAPISLPDLHGRLLFWNLVVAGRVIEWVTNSSRFDK